MDLNQLRCFVAAAEELHFGRAARRVEMLPSALGRFIRLLITGPTLTNVNDFRAILIIQSQERPAG